MPNVHDTTRTRSTEQDGHVSREQRIEESRIEELLKEIKKDRHHIAKLLRLNLNALTKKQKDKLTRFVAKTLKGQLSKDEQDKLLSNPSTALLKKLLGRLKPQSQKAQAKQKDTLQEQTEKTSKQKRAVRQNRNPNLKKFAKQPTDDSKRQMALTKKQNKTDTALNRSKALSAKSSGPGLRNPKLVLASGTSRNEAQTQTLLDTLFGAHAAKQLLKMGIKQPLELLRQGAMPGARCELAKQLGLSRAQLLTLLFRAELLRIGPGPKGQLGLLPYLVRPLNLSGLCMLRTLAQVHTLPQKDIGLLFGLFRKTCGLYDFKKTGQQKTSKQDFLYWSKAASTLSSHIRFELFAKNALTRDNAEEAIQLWYLEHLIDEQLDMARKAEEMLRRDQQRVKQDQGQQRHRNNQSNEKDDEQESSTQEETNDDFLFEYDHGRNDHLMCFWITDFNVELAQGRGIRRMYVCIDPETGAILPQGVEALHVSS